MNVLIVVWMLLQTASLGAVVAVQQMQLGKLRHIIEQLAMIRSDRSDACADAAANGTAGDSK